MSLQGIEFCKALANYDFAPETFWSASDAVFSVVPPVPFAAAS
jgi:hypothetical protein